MKDKRAAIQPVAEFLSYKVRCGEFTMEDSDKVFRLTSEKYEKADAILGILEMDLPPADTIMRIERL